MTANPILAAIKFVNVALHLYIVNKIAKFIAANNTQSESEKIGTIVSNSLSNYKVMISLNLQEHFFEKFSNEIQQLRKNNHSYCAKAGVFLSLRYGNDFFNNGFFFLVAAYLVKIQVVEISSIIEVVQVISASTWILIIVSVLLPNITEAISASKLVSQLLNYRPTIDIKSKEGLTNRISGKIEFSNVSFSFKNAVKVLDSCSFVLEPGESLGITGKTGSGKSTITMLLLRFYNASTGTIYIDNQDIKDYNIRHIRSCIGWVGQEPVLFQGSIFYNLQLANSEITREEALAALEKAQALDIVEDYGLDSEVGNRGEFLSGGQKQRVAIARALLRKCNVLILDEATSALDNITQNKAREMFKLQGITVIAIAHRIDSIVECDKIIIVDKGQIVQQGNHKELMKKKGFYRRLNRELSVD